MRRDRAARGVAPLAVAVVLAGCSEPAVLPARELEGWPIPRAWSAGERFGVVVLDRQTRDPATLLEGACTLSVGFAVATADGSLPELATAGACVETDAVGYDDAAPGLTPACVGVLAVSFGSVTRRIQLCDAEEFPRPMEQDCDDAAATTRLHVASAPGEVDGDVVGGLELEVPVAGAPRVSRPALQGQGTAVWPAGALELAWDPGPGAAVELVLRPLEGGGAAVRCVTADDGAFTFPEDLVAPHRAETVSVELARVYVARTTADGFTVRAASRTSTALQLFVGAGR